MELHWVNSQAANTPLLSMILKQCYWLAGIVWPSPIYRARTLQEHQFYLSADIGQLEEK